jgi:hypothetical protein
MPITFLFSITILIGLLCSVYAIVPSDYKLDKSIVDIQDETYAGFMPLHLNEHNDDGNFFFWLAKKREKSPPTKGSRNDKLLIWLNGGIYLI